MAIHQEVTIKGSPDKVYKALTNGKAFAAFTGAPAEIAASEGGVFSCFGGQITGRIIELAKPERVVQAWRAGNWPAGTYSIVSVSLQKAGTDTKVTLDHAGFPEDAANHLEAGWHQMYWDPLKAHFR
jgi:activator of HSP90 ATPase